MDSYISFADFYDGLTENVEYDKRCEYILKVFEKHNHKPALLLDLACGTGSLTIELAKTGIYVYGVDASAEMLCQAQSKAMEEGLQIFFLCQQMQELELYGLVDTCVCTLDSINHLESEEDVQAAFNALSIYMEKSGLFVFDVNTLYKHREILANNTFVYDTEDVFCVWQNTLLEDDVVEIDLDFFELAEDGAYIRSSESFCEKAYSHEKIAEMLQKAGFKLLACYGDMSFEKPKDDEQRAIYVAQKV